MAFFKTVPHDLISIFFYLLCTRNLLQIHSLSVLYHMLVRVILARNNIKKFEINILLKFVYMCVCVCVCVCVPVNQYT